MCIFMLPYLKDGIFPEKYVCNWIHFLLGWPNIMCPTNFHQYDEMKNMSERQVGIEPIWLSEWEQCILKIAFVWKWISFCLCVHEYTFKEWTLWMWTFILKRVPDVDSFHFCFKIRKKFWKFFLYIKSFHSISLHVEFFTLNDLF